MWEFSHSVVSDTAKPEDVWNIWKDVKNWPTWDPQIEWSKCEGDFAMGDTIELKPIKVPAVEGKISECVINSRFTVTASLALGTKITFSHLVEPAGPGVKIIHKVTISGAMSSVFQALVGKQIESGMPIAMENLLQQLNS